MRTAARLRDPRHAGVLPSGSLDAMSAGANAKQKNDGQAQNKEEIPPVYTKEIRALEVRISREISVERGLPAEMGAAIVDTV